MAHHSFKAQNFLVRNAILPYPNKNDQTFTEYSQIVDSVCKNSIFLEQLLLANPKLYDTLQKYKDGTLKKKRIKKLFESIYKYYKRSYLRSTPFGLFSETSIGKISEESQLTLSKDTSKCITLDSQWLVRLVHQMEIEFANKLSFIENNANYKFGDRVFQLYTINNSNLEEINIKLTKAYQIVSNKCKSNYFSYEEICNTIVANYGNEYRELAEQYVHNLIDNHYLLSNLQKDLLSDFDWDIFLSIIEEVDENKKYINQLLEIRKLIQEYSNKAIGEGISILKEIYILMSHILENDNYLQIDLFSNSEVHFAYSQIKQLENLANFVGNTTKSVSRTYLDDYKDKFIEKYGVNQEVQLLELFDPNFGIGAPYNYSHPRNDYFEFEPNTCYFTEKEKLIYLSKYVEAVKKHEFINFEDLDTYYQEIKTSKVEYIQGIELFFDITNENDKITFVLGNIIGNNNLGGASGRFSTIDTQIKKYHQTIVSSVEKHESEKGIISCEIVFLPENIRHANVMRTSIERKKVLPIFASTSHRRVQLDNIYIGIDNTEKFYIRDISSQEILKFHVTSMYNKTLFSNEIRFLYEISLDDRFGNFPWELIYAEFDYIPRIVFGEVVISPARWKILASDLEKQETLKELIQRKGLPQEFYIVNGDNKIHIAKDNVLDMVLLDSELKRGLKKNNYIELQEQVGQGVVLEKGHLNRVADIVIPFINSNVSNNQLDISYVNQRTIIDEREKLPFNEWLYLKMYISTNRQDEFLISYLPKVQKIVGDFGGELFFLRYSDPYPEIRLRLKSQDLFLVYNSIFKVLVSCRENRILSNFDISTYDQEIERYGGIEGLKLSEKIFCLDSKSIPYLLSLAKDDNNDLTLDDLSILTGYLFLKWFFRNNNKKILKFLNLVSPEKTKENINEKLKYYQKIISNHFYMRELLNTSDFNYLEKAIDDLGSQIQSEEFDPQMTVLIVDSIIHVHNNRLIGINRDKEKDIYYILQKLFISEEYLK
ncbi:lantibiotic dehydratase [Streptococcus intermedius]|uniref:lantibiotic dehydratase n=1 Tax=Streptococcus intermedius TaxID=1338 RepID=UPI000C85C9F6|nr:lantibiotic dehydratase [Streptococcus intermedius]PMR63762.1 Nisin biosynthesis protein NisB [Streptococcus intermedius]WOI90886.1 lantibiotic dehydratase [Streptococcus intermedius]